MDFNITAVWVKVRRPPLVKEIKGEGRLFGLLPFDFSATESVPQDSVVLALSTNWRELNANIPEIGYWSPPNVTVFADYSAEARPHALEVLQSVGGGLKAQRYKVDVRFKGWMLYGVFPTSWDSVTKSGTLSIDHFERVHESI